MGQIARSRHNRGHGSPIDGGATDLRNEGRPPPAIFRGHGTHVPRADERLFDASTTTGKGGAGIASIQSGSKATGATGRTQRRHVGKGSQIAYR